MQADENETQNAIKRRSKTPYPMETNISKKQTRKKIKKLALQWNVRQEALTSAKRRE
jgi:hypothetical protein